MVCSAPHLSDSWHQEAHRPSFIRDIAANVTTLEAMAVQKHKAEDIFFDIFEKDLSELLSVHDEQKLSQEHPERQERLSLLARLRAVREQHALLTGSIPAEHSIISLQHPIQISSPPPSTQHQPQEPIIQALPPSQPPQEQKNSADIQHQLSSPQHNQPEELSSHQEYDTESAADNSDTISPLTTIPHPMNQHSSSSTQPDSATALLHSPKYATSCIRPHIHQDVPNFSQIQTPARATPYISHSPLNKNLSPSHVNAETLPFSPIEQFRSTPSQHEHHMSSDLSFHEYAFNISCDGADSDHEDISSSQDSDAILDRSIDLIIPHQDIPAAIASILQPPLSHPQAEEQTSPEVEALLESSSLHTIRHRDPLNLNLHPSPGTPQNRRVSRATRIARSKALVHTLHQNPSMANLSTIHVSAFWKPSVEKYIFYLIWWLKNNRTIDNRKMICQAIAQLPLEQQFLIYTVVEKGNILKSSCRNHPDSYAVRQLIQHCFVHSFQQASALKKNDFIDLLKSPTTDSTWCQSCITLLEKETLHY